MIYPIIAVLIFTGDLLIKNHVEKNRNAERADQILGGRILLKKYHNEGACLNLGEKKSRAVAMLSLFLTAALTVVFIFTLTRRGNGCLKAGLSLLLGGAYSNTYDRLKRKYVVDYFSFNVKWQPLRQIVFNISDFCILIGALILALRGGDVCGQDSAEPV